MQANGPSENRPDASRESYIMGRTSHEYQRLRQQAKMWEDLTARILREAGLEEGMTCLDVGCGPGEVMRLMGEIVGVQGHVVGIDVDGEIGRDALRQLHAGAKSRFSFFEHDLFGAAPVPGGPFDMTYARFLLVHCPDPVGVLRKMHAATRPGGLIVVQDYDFQTVDVNPPLASWSEFGRVWFGVLERTGKDKHFGRKLPLHFVEAGIGFPDATDVSGRIGSLRQYGPALEAVYRSVLPIALNLGLTTQADSQAFLDELQQAGSGDGPFTLFWPLIVSLWKRKPG